MIISYELAKKAIEETISEYTASPEFKGYALWENIVTGLQKSLYILEELERDSSYSQSLSDIDADSLRNIKECINKKLTDLEKEDKVTVYRLTFDFLCTYYECPKLAREAMIVKLSELSYDQLEDISTDIRIIQIPQSEVKNYTIVKKEETENEKV